LFFFFRLFRPLVAGVLLAVVALPVGAVDLKTSDGSWTFSLNGNVNVHYIYSSCQNPSSAVSTDGLGLTCVGTQSSSSVSNIGNKIMGTFTLGRNIGLFGADAILADMTLPGVGAPGSAASAAPSNTTLGGIGFGYIYTDWLAQIDYTTVDISGFNATLGVFDPINSLTDPNPEPKQAPGFHAKLSYTAPLSGSDKLYLSVAFLTQEQR